MRKGIPTGEGMPFLAFASGLRLMGFLVCRRWAGTIKGADLLWQIDALRQYLIGLPGIT